MLTVQVWDSSMVVGGGESHPRLRPRAKPGRPTAVGSRSDPATDHRAAQRTGQDGAQIRRGREDLGARRAARRHGADQGLEKKHEIGEDLAKNWSDEVQKLTDQYIKKVDEALIDKEKDIRQV